MNETSWRKTTQYLAPASPTATRPGQYDIYPAFPIGDGKIFRGFDALAEKISDQTNVVIDGYGGVFWEELRGQLDSALKKRNITATWVSIDSALLPEGEIKNLVEPFLGGDDPLFGTRFTGNLVNFFDRRLLDDIKASTDTDVNILYGCGAALAGWDAYLIYVDVPKNEIQFRSRSGSITNLGCNSPINPKTMYKRFYFVDWVALNRHKCHLLKSVDLVIDEQRPKDITFASGSDVREALGAMSRSFFRVRPWFEPGPWGGQWIKNKMPQLAQDVPNYAWSFELIVPENGLALESSGIHLEISFDWLMYFDNKAIIGDSAGRFEYEFPIRFDFLDTFDGGNLSLQCHPRPEYARQHFGETFTQDETYYILDAGPDATVYIGFQEGVDPDEFRATLEHSHKNSVTIDVERFVRKEPAKKHDLFLIPNGTVHCSGVDNLVLEISATPYIFTFKMYDWMRLDLEGNPRPLNIDRAFENLYFERQGQRAHDELISVPSVLAEGSTWRRVHVPTHAEHFYDVHRLEFRDEILVDTDGSCQVMSLVEGQTVLLESGGRRQRFNYAETFVVPAAAGQFRLISESGDPIKVVTAFMKKTAAENSVCLGAKELK